ncbi:MAG: protein phosphatase 2C domain-containing protein [Desulfamplus sp.]|nr:protein phosphatase 2C domain-containing protein [Desulfamplus sp.]
MNGDDFNDHAGQTSQIDQGTGSTNNDHPGRTSQPAMNAHEQINHGDLHVKKDKGMPMKPAPANLICNFRLPNATCGKQYNASFAVPENNITITSVDGLEKTSLLFDTKTDSVVGTPSMSGEIPLKINFKLDDLPGTYTQNYSFIINPDPRSLWKDIPSDSSAVFWKKDKDSKEIELENGWKIVAASNRGRSHAHDGRCRDDHFYISTDPSNGWSILAVADGAGSAAYSREGARIAVTESARVLKGKLKEYDSEITSILMNKDCSDTTEASDDPDKVKIKNLLYNIFSQAVYEPVKVIHDTVEQHKRKKEHDNGPLLGKTKFRDFNTTLIAAVHKKIKNAHFIASYWIGDGGIAVYCEDDFVHILGEGDSGEFAGQTIFLDHNAINKDDIYNRIKFDWQKSITALILMTDGITDPCFETDHQLNQVENWDHLWKNEIKTRLSHKPDVTSDNLLGWLDFWSQGNHDDRTLAMMFKHDGNTPKSKS